MKKLAAFVLAIIFIISFSGCGMSLGAEKVISDSEIFRPGEINKAMFVVYKHFMLHFEGCILLKVEYNEEYSKPRAKEWAEHYDADEAIVLLSDFYVYSAGDGSLSPGQKYTKWNWILVRNNDGTWKLKDWGYG